MTRAKRKVAWHVFCRSLQVIATAVMMFAGFVVATQFGPSYETRFLPVARDFQAQLLENYDGTICFRPTFEKARDCEYLDMNWFATFADGHAAATTWWDPTRPGKQYSRPTGRADGIRWCVQEQRHAVSYFGIVEHDCRLPWTTRTVLGPIPAP